MLIHWWILLVNRSILNRIPKYRSSLSHIFGFAANRSSSEPHIFNLQHFTSEEQQKKKQRKIACYVRDVNNFLIHWLTISCVFRFWPFHNLKNLFIGWILNTKYYYNTVNFICIFDLLRIHSNKIHVFLWLFSFCFVV